MNRITGFCLLLVCCFSFGCSALEQEYQKTTQKVDKIHAENTSETIRVYDDYLKMSAESENKVTERNRAFAGVQKMSKGEYSKAQSGGWLQKKITIKVNKPIGGHELLKTLSSQGVNITSSIPLGEMKYTGYGVQNLPVEAALQSLLGAMRLDYQIDYENQVVVVTPSRWKTWYFNLGSRTTEYVSGGGTSSGSSSSSSSSSDGDDEDEAVASTGSSDSSQGSITSQDDFWESLQDEIEERMTILVPVRENNSGNNSYLTSFGDSDLDRNPAAEAMAQEVQSQDNDTNDLFQEQLIGRCSFNPETGAVNVQAPHWIIEDLDKYFKRVRLQYDTVITFEGRLYMVKSDSDHSRGFDLSVFSEFISGYNLFMRNNALGGITLSTDDAFNISSGAKAVASNLFGVGKTDGSFNVFSAFLEKIGDVSIVQKPIISTTSGVPGYFSKFERQYYNTVSQQTASGGTGSAVVGTTNELVPVEFGTLLRINPRYDVDTGLVRAQLALSQKFLSGFQQTTQQISAGDKVVDVPVTIPLLTQSTYEGETIMRDGDLIIIGGQIEQESQKEEQGVPIVKDVAGIGDFFGTGVKSSSNLTYYFALTVKIEKM